MAIELSHKALAETHNFSVGFALRIKVAAALAAAHRESGQTVFQDLLKPEEFDDGKIDRRMEPQTALVGTDRRVELNSVAAVHLYFSVVVDPWHAEDDDPFRLYETFHKACLFPFGMIGNYQLKTFKNLLDSLKKLRLTGVIFLEISQNTLKVFVGNHNFLPSG